jgi:hypothetical protein
MELYYYFRQTASFGHFAAQNCQLAVREEPVGGTAPTKNVPESPIKTHIYMSKIRLQLEIKANA